MEIGKYQRLLASVTLPSSAEPHIPALARAFAVSEDTVRCIYAQEVQSRVKKRHAALLAGIEAAMTRFDNGGSMGQPGGNGSPVSPQPVRGRFAGRQSSTPGLLSPRLRR